MCKQGDRQRGYRFSVSEIDTEQLLNEFEPLVKDRPRESSLLGCQ